jgi:hypothetical protein
MVNDWVAEAALYELLPTVPAAAAAVIMHGPTPVVPPLVVHGPDAVKLTGSPAEDDALNENVLPYCTFGNCEKLIVCDCVLEFAARIVNVPDTELAGL